jgi:hypothetical protein
VCAGALLVTLEHLIEDSESFTGILGELSFLIAGNTAALASRSKNQSIRFVCTLKASEECPPSSLLTSLEIA